MALASSGEEGAAVAGCTDDIPARFPFPAPRPKQTMTWVTSKTSSAYSRSETKASFDPLLSAMGVTET